MTDDPIRVFVGCSANDEDLESQLVLDYTLHKHTDRQVILTWMRFDADPCSPFYSNAVAEQGWNARVWATPFSGFRWAIPELCHFEGKAIYLDSDFIIQDDIGKLWDEEFKEGKIIIAKGSSANRRFCCSMWDCEAARPHVLPLITLMRDERQHQKMMHYFSSHPGLVQSFSSGDWNAMDTNLPTDLKREDIKAIHYTRMDVQPHLRYAVPRLKAQGKNHWYYGKVVRHEREDLIQLFDEVYFEALDNGYSLKHYVNPSPFGKYRFRGDWDRRARR